MTATGPAASSPVAAVSPGAGASHPAPGHELPGTAEGKSAVPGIHPAAKAMSEADLEAGIRRILKSLKDNGHPVLAYHPWSSKHSASGWPDWTFCTETGILFRELKQEHKKPTPAQAAWLAALRGAGQSADTWRPSDLLSGRIARELAALAGLGGAG